MLKDLSCCLPKRAAMLQHSLCFRQMVALVSGASPSVLDAHLRQDDSQGHIAAEGDEHNDGDPDLELGRDEDAGGHHIKQLRHNAEEHCKQGVNLNTALPERWRRHGEGAMRHTMRHLQTCMPVLVLFRGTCRIGTAMRLTPGCRGGGQPPVERTCWMAEVPLSMTRVTSPVLRMRCQRRSRSMAFWNMSTLMDLRDRREFRSCWHPCAGCTR